MIEGLDLFDLVKHRVTTHELNVETKLIRDHFENKIGKFLIIGADGGDEQGLFLLSKGWTGVYVEPNPDSCRRLLQHTQEYIDKVTIYNMAVSNHSDLADFFVATDESYLSSLHQDWRENINKRKIKINLISFEKLLSETGYDFDYVQIDTEGHDHIIIESIDWGLLPNCQMLCTEAGPMVLYHLAITGNYEITDITPTNAIYRKNNGQTEHQE